MEDIVVGIDIGTTKVCTLIGKTDKTGQLQILGRGFTLFNGVKKGIIVDIEETAEAIRLSVEEVEDEANFKVNSAYVNIHGTHVNIINHKESTSVLNDSQVVMKEDIEKMLQSIERLPVSEGNRIIDIIPRQYIVDGYEGILDPVGMSGLILEMEADIITGKLTSVQNIIRSVEKAGLNVDGIITEAYATGEISLLSEEKEIGVILIDVGGGITDVSAFKNGKIVMYDSIPVGGEHVTNDISIGLRISYNEADKLKKQYELALTTLITNDQEISVYDVNEEKSKDVKVSKIIEIIEARVFEILFLAKNLVEKHENIDMYRAGVVLTGGGISYVNGSKQIAEDIFNLPVRVASCRSIPGAAKPEFATAAGIIKHAAKRNMYSRISGAAKEPQTRSNNNGKGGDYLKKIAKAIYRWFSM